jgi:5-aminopentanamidase
MAIRVGLVQMNSIAGAVVENREKALSLVRAAADQGAQVVLIPETFTTGYDIEDRLASVAEPIPGPTSDAMASEAARLGVYIYGSILEREGDAYHNTGLFLSPQGELLARYRKVHLFADEKRLFRPGDQAAVVRTPIGTFGLTICMDLLFPEYTRGLVLAGAEYILNSTDWLRWGPLDQWEWCAEQTRALARTRALENTVGLAMACQWGTEGEFTKFGHSCIVSPSGRILAGIEGGEGVLVHDLSMDDVGSWRKVGTYLADRQDHLELYRSMLDL